MLLKDSLTKKLFPTPGGPQKPQQRKTVGVCMQQNLTDSRGAWVPHLQCEDNGDIGEEQLKDRVHRKLRIERAKGTGDRPGDTSYLSLCRE